MLPVVSSKSFSWQIYPTNQPTLNKKQEMLLLVNGNVNVNVRDIDLKNKSTNKLYFEQKFEAAATPWYFLKSCLKPNI